MKNLYAFLIVLGLISSSFNVKAQTITWTDSFTNGVPATASQITAWNNFRAQLLSTYCYTSMKISGTYDTTGQICTDPTIVAAYAGALNVLTDYTSTLTNGNVWSICNRYDGEVWLNPPSQCSGANCPTGYIIRPGIGTSNQNWGGVNTATCSGPTQTMTFTFEYATVGTISITCPANITVPNDTIACGAIVNYPAPTVYSCSSYTVTQIAGLASGSAFPVGTTTNTFEATDGSQTSSCSFTVTVTDTVTPSITCPANITSCNSIVTGIAPTVTDNCSGETVAFNLIGATTGSGANDASGTTFNAGTTTVWYIVTDIGGNKDSCSFDVVVNIVDTSTSLTGFTTTANATGATYVWLDCNNGYADITGATGQSYTATANGNYAVEITQNGCTDTSACITVAGIGIKELMDNAISIYPNPTNNIINIDLDKHNEMNNYSLSTIEGRIIKQEKNVLGNSISIDLSNESKGIYLLRIDNLKSVNMYKIIKQ